jgi:Mce-associated membrane protein
MANTSLRGRGGTGSPARRSLSAAARAAAKRAERAGEPAEGVVAGRTLRPEDPPPGSEAPEPDREAPDREGPDQPDGETDGETDSGGDASPARAGGSGRRRGVLCAVLALLVVLGLVAAAVLALEYRDGRAAERARAGAAEAARKAAPVVLSYDHRHLDRDFAAARAHLTGSFRAEYRRTTTSVVAPTARKYRGVVRATVVAPPGGGEPAVSVVSASPDRAVVLLFVNQITTSTQVSGPRVDLNRVRMTLARTSGGWKVSAVDAL